jgi:hypothetical protein
MDLINIWMLDCSFRYCSHLKSYLIFQPSFTEPFCDFQRWVLFERYDLSSLRIPQKWTAPEIGRTRMSALLAWCYLLVIFQCSPFRL